MELIYTLGEMSYRSDMSAPSILNVIELAKKFYPEGVSVLPTTAGTGPMHTVLKHLKCQWQLLDLVMQIVVTMVVMRMYAFQIITPILN